jgi:dolichol kinase
MTPNLTSAYLVRVLAWHSLLLLLLLIGSQVMRALEPGALLLGGVFMGLNFGLLSVGIRWVLSPTASRKKQRLGMALLSVKLLLFLGLVSALFFRMNLDGVSFVVGVSSLLVASLIGTLASGPSFSST